MWEPSKSLMLNAPLQAIVTKTKNKEDKNILLFIILDQLKPFYSILLLRVDHLAMVNMLSIGQMIAGERRMVRRGQ